MGHSQAVNSERTQTPFSIVASPLFSGTTPGIFSEVERR